MDNIFAHERSKTVLLSAHRTQSRSLLEIRIFRETREHYVEIHEYENAVVTAEFTPTIDHTDLSICSAQYVCYTLDLIIRCVEHHWLALLEAQWANEVDLCVHTILWMLEDIDDVLLALDVVVEVGSGVLGACST